MSISKIECGGAVEIKYSILTILNPFARVRLKANDPAEVPSVPGTNFSTRRTVARGRESRQDFLSNEAKAKNEAERYNLPD